jgi:hypothetical protein
VQIILLVKDIIHPEGDMVGDSGVTVMGGGEEASGQCYNSYSTQRRPKNIF